MIRFRPIRALTASKPKFENAGRKTHAVRRLMVLRLLSVLLFLSILEQAATQTPGGLVRGSYTYGGTELEYAYDARAFSGARGSNRGPGLLVYFHGDGGGDSSIQLLMSGTPYNDITTLAWKHGLIPVVIKAPRFDHYRTDRRFHSWNYQPVEDTRQEIFGFLLRGFDNEFGYDKSRTILWGCSGGSAFLSTFFQSPDAVDVFQGGFGAGMILSSGAQARRGPDGSPWFLPAGDASQRFKVFVQSPTPDIHFINPNSRHAYYAFLEAGWNAVGDLHHPGEHCLPGRYSGDEAIGWILGTTRYKMPDGTLGLMSNIDLGTTFTKTEQTESVKIRQGSDGNWRIGDLVIESGHEHVLDDGGTILLDLSDDEEGNEGWRVAEHTISSLAGTGEAGFAGDGGPATGARLDNPQGIAIDADGTLYFADSGNHRIRRIDPSGAISTIAGTGVAGFSGDGGPATWARLRNPRGIAVNPWDKGAIYIADSGNHRIRRIDATGEITTIAGTGVAGFSGDSGLAAQVHLSDPQGIAVSQNGGRIYVADSGNHRIRAIFPPDYGDFEKDGWRVETIAGAGAAGFSGDGGPPKHANLNQPTGIAVWGSQVYFVDSGHYRIRVIDGDIRTVAILRGGIDALTGKLTNWPRSFGVAVDGLGNLYITDGNTIQRRIRIDRWCFSCNFSVPIGPISRSVIAGRLSADFEVVKGVLDSTNGLPGSAAFDPSFLAVDSVNGRIIFSDIASDRIRYLNLLDHLIPAYKTEMLNWNLSSLSVWQSDDIHQYRTEINTGTQVPFKLGFPDPSEVVPATVYGTLELDFEARDSASTSNPQFADGSHKVNFHIPSRSNVAIFGNGQSAINLLAGTAEGRIRFIVQLIGSDEEIDLPLESWRVREIDIETASVTENPGTGNPGTGPPAGELPAVRLVVDPGSVSELDETTQVLVRAELVGGARSVDTSVTVTVTGTGVESAVDFAAVSPFIITIPAGTSRGNGGHSSWQSRTT